MAGQAILQRGDQVPFFDVATTDGGRVSYGEVWQRQPLLLVSLPPDAPARGLPDALRTRLTGEARVVITHDAVPGLQSPAVVVADRWGEIQHVGPLDAGSPDLDDLADWVRFVQLQCPECQGESR